MRSSPAFLPGTIHENVALAQSPDDPELRRILRQHLLWLDFLARAASGCDNWLPTGESRARRHKLALAEWYGGEQP